MRHVRVLSLLLFVSLLLTACPAAIPIPVTTVEGTPAAEAVEAPAEMPAVGETEGRLLFEFVAVNALDTVESHLLGMQGHGIFDPQNVEDIEGGGFFFQWDNAAEGVPKPIVGLGVGSWRVVRAVSFTPQGETFGLITPGVLDLVVELMPEEGEAVEATLRVICNVGPAGLVNMEDGEPLPEGYILTVDEMGTFAPIVSAEPGVPPFGLTHIGPAPVDVAAEMPAVGETEGRLLFSYVAVNALDAVEGHVIGMNGYGIFDPQNVEDIEGGGSFTQWDNAVEGTAKPIVGLGAGTWQVVRGVSFTPQGETYGALTPGVLEMVVELMPEEGEAVEATLRVICNAGPGGLINMENGEPLPEGYILTVAEMGTFAPIVSPEPGVPPFGLTWIGPAD